jgi:hypothetical protein
LWDIEPDHDDLGFVMRKNAKPICVCAGISFVNLSNALKKMAKKLRGALKDTPLHQCILIEYTGTYEAFYDNGSLELVLILKMGFCMASLFISTLHLKKLESMAFYEGEKHGLGTLYIKDDTGDWLLRHLGVMA